MKRALVIAIATLLSGCAAINRMGPPNCVTQTCTVTVTVHRCNDIRVDFDPLVVQPGRPIQVEWNLVGGGQWSFVDDGIRFKRDTEAEFEGKEKQARKFKWKYKNSKPRRHWYDVNVTDGNRVCTLDPSIMNN